jgi:hypothetical protein
MSERPLLSGLSGTARLAAAIVSAMAGRFAGVILLLAAEAGCQCPKPTFATDARFEVTVVQNLGTPRPFQACGTPSLMAGDAFELIGAGGHATEMECDEAGDLIAAKNTPAFFAKDVLTTCDKDKCTGVTAAACPVSAQFTAFKSDPDGRWTFVIDWSSTCDAAYICQERYEFAFKRLAG